MGSHPAERGEQKRLLCFFCGGVLTLAHPGRMCAFAQVACLAEHQLNVSDLAWSSDSTELMSVGFDSAAKLWDVNKAECVR